MTLSDKLARLITNQSEIARKTGIAQSAISEATAGKRRLYVDQAFKLARAIGVSVDYLADDAQEVPQPPTLTADEERSLWLIRELGLTAGELARRLTGEPGGKGLAAMVGHADESEMAKRRAIEEKRRLGFELEGDVQATGGDLKDGPSGPRRR